jgi:hypothetical protein
LDLANIDEQRDGSMVAPCFQTAAARGRNALIQRKGQLCARECCVRGLGSRAPHRFVWNPIEKVIEGLHFVQLEEVFSKDLGREWLEDALAILDNPAVKPSTAEELLQLDFVAEALGHSAVGDLGNPKRPVISSSSATVAQPRRDPKAS